MSERLVNALIALRKACLDTRRTVGNDAATMDLDFAATVLSRMIVDATQLPRFHAEACETYSRTLPAGVLPPDGTADYARLASSLQARLKQAGGFDAETEKALLRSVTANEVAMLRHWGNAIREEISKGTNRPSANEVDDQLNTEALRNYLRELYPEDSTLDIANAGVASRGYSKKTWLVTLSGASRLPAEIVLRVDRPFNYLGTTVVDEFPVLTKLFAGGARVPQAFALEPSGRVLGNPFIVFAKADGSAVGNNFLFPPRNPALCRDLAVALASIHTVPIEGLALPNAHMTPKQRLEALIDKMYADWVACNADVPLLEASFRWLRANIDRAVGPETLVHGDYSLSNILVSGDRVCAVVDWEFARRANPADDLGYFYFAAEALGGYDLFLQTYASAGGRVPRKEMLDYYRVWGQTRLSVMTQQVDAGFAAGRWDEIKYGLSAAIHVTQVLIRLGSALENALSS